MRNLPYITVGRILQELAEDGLPIPRPTFYHKERAGVIPIFSKNSAGWRIYDSIQARNIKLALWREFRGKEDAERYEKKLDEQN